MTTTVLFCAAPGTELSRIVRSLEDHPGRRVWDLEAILCANLPERSRHPGTRARPRNMNMAVRRPRPELYRLWVDTYLEISESIATERRVEINLWCMHLTWYNADTREFFSPINAQVMHDSPTKIDHVVVLIDDVFDMFSRLRRPFHLYDERGMSRLKDGISKLSGLPAIPALGFPERTDSQAASEMEVERDDGEREKELEAQAIELALAELIAWRRAEMIQAENLAKTLGCKLTVYGTKHSHASLAKLLENIELPRVYLSHRITEVRRANYSSARTAGGKGIWHRVTTEVNWLNRGLAKHDALLINPTAIDELRFVNLSDRKSRSPRLAARWPLPKPVEGLLWNAPQGGHEHQDLLTANINAQSAVTSAVAASLSHRIYVEIAFRDHVIVENTPGLCVYRPFFQPPSRLVDSKPEWSGGVYPEIQHWKKCQSPDDMLEGSSNVGQESRPGVSAERRVAFVHTQKEIRQRIALLCRTDKEDVARRFVDNIRSHTKTILSEWRVEDDQNYLPMLDQMFAELRDPSHLSDDPIPDFALEYPLYVIDALHAGFPMAYYHAFTTMDRDPGTEQINAGTDEQEAKSLKDVARTMAKSSADVLLLKVKQDKKGAVKNKKKMAKRLGAYFAGELDVEAENMKFWEYCLNEFSRISGHGFGVFAAQAVGVSYARLSQRAVEPPFAS